MPKKWAAGHRIVRRQDVETPFGTRPLPVVSIPEAVVGDERIRDLAVMASRTRFPLVGNDVLFRDGEVALSASGFSFARPAERFEPLASYPLQVTHRSARVGAGVRSVFLQMIIDGNEQHVFLDTGRPDLLTGTARAGTPPDAGRRKFDIRFNALGQWKPSSYQNRTASVDIGGRVIDLPYRHYSNDHSIEAPFILGAAILREFDLWLSSRTGKAQFFKAGSLLRSFE